MFTVITNCFGENLFKINNVPKIKAITSVAAPIQMSLKNEGPSISNIFSFDFTSIKLNVGVSFNGKATDTIVDFLISPIKLNNFQWSIWTGYHLYDYFGSFREHDFLAGSYVLFYPIKNLWLKLDNGSILKTTDFYNTEITNILFKASYFLGFSVIWDINDIFRTYVEARSLSTFDYPLMGTPFFSLGVEARCTPKITIGIDYTVKMIDMVAVAENISEMLLQIYSRIEL